MDMIQFFFCFCKKTKLMLPKVLIIFLSVIFSKRICGKKEVFRSYLPQFSLNQPSFMKMEPE